MAKLFRLYSVEIAGGNYRISTVALGTFVQYVLPKNLTDYQSVFDSEKSRNMIAGPQKQTFQRTQFAWHALYSRSKVFSLQCYFGVLPS